jgi:ABC-type phosphate/phosphonate transport system ATPase subunit
VDPVTVAVVGALGAGKSTVIRQGAKEFSLSDFTVLSAPPGMLGVQTPLRCALI